jgi:hypothetical protein
MDTPRHFHAIFRPSVGQLQHQREYLEVIETDNPHLVELCRQSVPGALAMELYARNREELQAELRELGFPSLAGGW